MLTHRFPARPLLVCAGNPCPCGFSGDVARACTCGPARLDAYRGRLSGPVIDRIDIWVEVGRLSPQELSGAASGEPSESVRQRVEKGESFRASRGQDVANAEVPASEVRERSRLSTRATALARRAVDELALSGRGYDRLLKVSRTTADLSEAESVGEEHLSEALGLRRPAVAP
jgi:magnesium chelatase family protein